MYDLNFSGSMDDDVNYVVWLMSLFHQARTGRVNFETQWEESAALFWPDARNSFAFGHNRPPGVKYTEYQVDSAGMIASHRFMSICDMMITPFTQMWSRIQCNDKTLMARPEVKAYYDDVTRILWESRYRAEANFISQNQMTWLALGVFGNAGMFTEPLDTRPGQWGQRGPRYMSTFPGQMYILEGHQGRVDGFIRHLRWSARSMAQRWGLAVPIPVKSALEKNSPQLFDILHFCLPNTEYDPLKIFSQFKQFPWIDIYVCVQGEQIMSKSGHRSFPWSPSRYIQAPEEVYARGPGQICLADGKTRNAEKAMFLKVGHRAADPALIIGDDGLIDLKSQPGAFNFGGFSPQGKLLVGMLPHGELQVSQEMLNDNKVSIDDAFLVSLFPALMKDMASGDPNMPNVRQATEALNQRGIFLSPLGRQYGEYLGNMIDRELDILSYLNMLPQLPEALKKELGSYRLVYSSPLMKILANSSHAGYMKMVDFAKEIVEITADASLMYRFDFDTALPEMAEDLFVPARWMASDALVKQKTAQAEKQAERDRQVKELPGKAAMAKAQAIVTKAQTGGNTGGALTGTPSGGMPMMPGQSAPGGRTFGQPG